MVRNFCSQKKCNMHDIMVILGTGVQCAGQANVLTYSPWWGGSWYDYKTHTHTRTVETSGKQQDLTIMMRCPQENPSFCLEQFFLDI